MDGAITLWNPADGRGTKTFQGHYHGVHAIAFSPDGTTLATGGADLTDSHEPEVKLWVINELMRKTPARNVSLIPAQGIL